MATCNDCIHYDICIFHITENENERCPHFKNKSDVVEVKHGEWIEDGYYDNPCVCSNCGAEANYVSTFEETFDYDWEENLQHTGYEEHKEYIKTPYCPNCGAKMDGKTNLVFSVDVEKKNCSDCKYYMFGTCLHPHSSNCNHSELWAPIGYGEFNISMFKLPDEIQDLIDVGIYTEEEVVEHIRKHR